MARRLRPDEVHAACDPARLAFGSTAELPVLDGMIGQPRAVAATRFGIGMRSHGYNLFALGPPRTGKTSAMRRVLERTAGDDPTPDDVCYVFNFADPHRPTALTLPAGRGRDLRAEMRRLVEECGSRLPRAFESPEFEAQRSKLLEALADRQREGMEALETAVGAEGFALLRTPGGLALVPAPRGEPLSPAEFAALPPAQQQAIEARGHGLEERLQATLRQLRQLEREAREEHDKLLRSVAAAAVGQLLVELRERFAGLAAVLPYLDGVEADLVSHAEEFRQLTEPKPSMPFLPPPGAFLDRYQVNLLVDRAGQRGAPVVVEPTPTYRNLVGHVEHRVHFGTLVTDFTLVYPGALHRANGGYLILDALDLLRNPFAWDALKKALKGGAIRLEDPLEEFRGLAAGTLAPEPVPLAVKVVLIGNPMVYYLLHGLDEDFGELFKVKVDFDSSMPRTEEFEMLYARFVAGACQDEGLPPFSADAVARLVEHGSRLAGDRGRLTSALGVLLDVIREAAFWTVRRTGSLVEGADVTRAIAEKRDRSSLVQERIERLIDEGTLLIDVEGEAVGQVNGIAVLSLGDYAFGKPARITARTYAGEPGVVDIEREVKLGGPTHSKGVMILTGYLAGRYSRERPLALAASIAFEQQYEEVEGDSASSAELYALLSSLGGIPLSQRLAVTGSVNQQGEIQAVGGINEKIEGYFDVCRRRGLTGGQGVVIPAANVRHLMLREDVVAAVAEGRFSVHAVATVDEGIALLTGRPAGERGADGRFPDGTVNAAVDAALAAHAARLRTVRGDGAALPAAGAPPAREPTAPGAAPEA